MKVVSNYVREQQRYTKNQLRTMFAFDESHVEKFIKSLKSYGILKTVANTVEQKELTDLVDEDIQITTELAENDECYYVFTYVGVVTIGSRVIKSYPKYVLNKNDLLTTMKQVIKVLERYSHSEEQIVNLFNGTDDNRSFNVLPIILFLLNDYYAYGVYNNIEEVIEVNGEGDIIWNRTIDDGFAIIKDGLPYYTELITCKSVEDDTDYFKRLHECILTECSKQLQEAALDELFEVEALALSDETLEDFGEKEYILERIIKELNIQFNTHRQILLKTIYAYVSQNQKIFEDNQCMSMFGTTAFYAVWEKACAEVFGNKLDVPIGKLRMRHPLADGYNAKTRLIDLIEKPKWCGQGFIHEPKDTLIPDLITITESAGQDCFIIFDSKYYLIQLDKNRALRGNPGVGDVVKQYMYQLAYKNFLKDHNIKVVKNCFLMPTEGNDIVNIGRAKMDMLHELGLEDIQICLIPASLLFSYYLRRKRIAVEKLGLN